MPLRVMAWLQGQAALAGAASLEAAQQREAVAAPAKAGDSSAEGDGASVAGGGAGNHLVPSSPELRHREVKPVLVWLNGRVV